MINFSFEEDYILENEMVLMRLLCQQAYSKILVYS